MGAVVSVVVVVVLALAWLSPSSDLGPVVAGAASASGASVPPNRSAVSSGPGVADSSDPPTFLPGPGTSRATPDPDRPTTTVPADTAAPADTSTTSTLPPASVAPTAPPQDAQTPAVVARPVPSPTPEEPPPAAAAPAWTGSTITSPAGFVSTDVGCTSASPPGGAALDVFFSGRVGPVIGWDYQHVYPLGGDRYLWLFQDAFIDHSGGATTLAQSSFAHNVALLQDGGCFRLLHRGTPGAPAPFEEGTGSSTLSTWFWPMGGELHGGELHVFWARMVKDPFDPPVPDGLGWHPADTWIATYDPVTLARLDFRRAPNSSAVPIYGYAVASDATHTYLFGNTFEQNLAREGGYWARQHSATAMYLARVPRGQVFAAPQYRTSSGWSGNPADALPILQRHWAEFPMQPRLVDGQWVAAAAVDGYWGDALTVDVANEPWGPWTTVQSGRLLPRNGDPTMNTYHAHLAPWRDGLGNLVVTVSNNARDMRRDAWSNPHRYRPTAFVVPWTAAPPDPRPTPTATAPVTSSPRTTVAPTTKPTTTTTTTTTTTSSTTTTPPPSSTSSTSSTTSSIPDAPLTTAEAVPPD